MEFISDNYQISRIKAPWPPNFPYLNPNAWAKLKKTFHQIIFKCKEELNSRLSYVLRKLNERYVINTQNINVFYVTDNFIINDLDIDLDEIEFW